MRVSAVQVRELPLNTAAGPLACGGVVSVMLSASRGQAAWKPRRMMSASIPIIGKRLVRWLASSSGVTRTKKTGEAMWVVAKRRARGNAGTQVATTRWSFS